MIYMFLANGFEEVEALMPLDLMRRAGLEVTTVGVGGLDITGSHGITVKADMLDADFASGAPECVILPGGMPGTLNLEKSPIVTQSVRYCNDNNLLICAICAAPSILGHMGLLKNKEAVCFPGFENELKGAILGKGNVAVDGNIITAKSAGYAIDFSLEITAILKDRSESEKIRKALQCN